MLYASPKKNQGWATLDRLTIQAGSTCSPATPADVVWLVRVTLGYLR